MLTGAGQATHLLWPSGDVSMIEAKTESFVKLLRECGVNGEPCDEWAIRELEQQLGVEFPPAYRAFVALAGNGCEPLEGSHYAVEDDLASLQRSAGRIMKHDGLDLLTDAFVFLVHQGHAFNFFLLNDGEDPAVYEYVQGMPPVRQVAPRLTEWFANEVSRSRAYREERADGA
jgi:hypothetical protein